MVHLSLITERTSDAWQEQANRVAECFRRQLSLPLLNIEDTYTEMQEWIKRSDLPPGIVDEPNVKWTYTSSRRLLEKYRVHENELLVHKDRLTVYQKYIEDVKKPTHVICLYERAVAELSLTSELWLQYCRYLKKLSMPTAEVIDRALRNCPWSEDIWVFQIREMEETGKEFNEITLKLETGLESVAPSRGLQLWLSYLEYAHRNPTLSLIKLNQLFEQAQQHLAGPEAADPTGVVARFHARILANKDDMPGARRIWSDILAVGMPHRRMATAWLEYAALERFKGAPAESRQVFQKALAAVKDWPQSICEEWLMFERECGTLETMLQCVEKCSAVPKIQETSIAADEGNSRERNGKRKFDGKDTKTKTFAEKRKRGEAPSKESYKGRTSTSNLKKQEEEGKFAKLTRQPEPPKPQLDIHALDPHCTVFVSNISSVVTEDRLKQIFPNAKQIDLMRDVNGKSRGHGYVQFPSNSDVHEAIGRDREPLDGRPVFISRFKPAREERQHAFSKGKEENKLFVKGLPRSVTQEQVAGIFNEFGRAKVRLVLHRSGQPKGLAYVEFSTKEEAAAALKATDNIVFEECTISVAISAPPRRAVDGGGGYGGGGGSGSGTEFWRREPSRPFKSRLQVPLIPRVLSAKSPAAAAVSDTKVEATDNNKSTPKTNQDFRNMLL